MDTPYSSSRDFDRATMKAERRATRIGHKIHSCLVATLAPIPIDETNHSNRRWHPNSSSLDQRDESFHGRLGATSLKQGASHHVLVAQ